MFGRVNIEGHLNFVSTIASKPSFSFGHKHSNKRIFNNGVNESHLQGSDAPGVGHYKWENSDAFQSQVSYHQPLYGISNAARSEVSPVVSKRKGEMKSPAVPTLFGNQERFFEFEDERELRA